MFGSISHARVVAGCRATCAALLLLLAAMRPAVADFYQVHATSSLALASFLVQSETTPVGASDGRCRGQSCGHASARSGHGGLGAYALVNSGYLAQAAGISVVAMGRGQLTVFGAPGSPAFLDVAMNLHFGGQFGGSFAGGSAQGQVGLTASIGGAVHASGVGSYTEYMGYNGVTPAPVAQNMVRAPGMLHWQGIRVPVGVPFELTLTLGAQVGTIGEASVLVDWMNSASPALDGPVFNLPNGYTVQSSFWALTDNRFCPGGCTPPVPEPSTASLWVAGLLLSPLLCRRRRVRRGASL